ncbi:hypothetical protein AB2T96_06615 [Clostridium butyricum]|jgi:hypothetical protein|uniref:Uncharacterized protein n=1 Tax=Clostridium butyricum TaxID=1492 RepID=A0A512TJL5_CLOBU|nr:hypothetical protein [Clostridium butyricum]MDU1005137.1 hypothetical protein [Clostridium butyricum]MDU5722470.1 hypothetical protein [Clostridium butyricum]MDU5820704.1 hypothetical protein [Clostridium butyricum]NAS19040.1 hypothetical protein [Clostridium butyricum]NOW24783.1 site-specific recombinase XerD [Clostridium butyricum]
MNIYNNISSYQNTLNYSQEQISNKNKQSSVKIDFQNVKYTQTSTDQVNLSGNSQTFESSKIKNLLNNDKVMTMLKDIASLNGGTISLWQ